ncbi:hypothetical protein ACQKP0_10435 [Heyndrickxia sp. NPDC080065]|uniref:hypothetical protein n=1 Tax=Heyndrickxia sp. NPDC080065 TaxID=3390568 RepID=UPI003D094476
MIQFFGRRVISSKPMYFVLFAGIIISLLHVKLEIIPQLKWLRLGLQDHGVDSTPYSEWFEFGVATSLTMLFFLLLPILASLPFADTFSKDKQSGYLRSILSKGKMKEYFKGLYITNFITSGVMITIPLLVNIYLAFMILPNVKPDPVVNSRMSLDFMNSFFPELYYSHPLIHMLFYVVLAFLFSGMFATISLSISFFVKNRFFILVSGFLLQMILSLVFQFTENYGWIPSSFLLEQSQPSVSLVVTVFIFCCGMMLSTLIYILGVKKRVIT